MTKTLTPLIILVLLLLLPATSALGQGICGDVDGSGTINVSDMTYLIAWIIMDGPPPPDTVMANADLCDGVDVGDIACIIDYLFLGGPPPCSGSANCSPNSGGIITLDSVGGELSPGVISTGDSITFYLRYTNNTGDNILDISNGFRVYSTDGAQWGATIADITGALNYENFYLGIFTNTYSAEGSGADTVGTLAGTWEPPEGMPVGFDDVAFTITIGPIGSAYIGKTICLDSCFYGPGGSWKWQVDGQNHYAPDWGGPYCFTIQEPVLEVTPDTLNFSVYQWSYYPVCGSFHVSEALGANIPFQCDYIESGSFISLSSFSGITPDDIMVWANGYGKSPGTYQNVIVVDAEAWGTPLEVIVNMTVYADPEAAMILDNVVGHYGTTGIKTGVPVTFTMRAINNSGEGIYGTTNAYRIYSPDGAQWDTLTADTFSAYVALFDGGFFISEINVDGSGTDTIGLGGAAIYSSGMPNGYNDLAYSITIGPIDSVYDGQIICVDSSWYPPAGPWLWANNIGGQIYPEWSGPHCFTVYYVPYTLVVDPDTLHFSAIQGGSNPPAQSLFVGEAGGADIVYYIDSVEAPFFVDKTGGHTPDSVVVTTDVYGLSPGTYTQSVTFDALNANNTPLTVYLELTVTEPGTYADSLIFPSVAVDQVCGAVQPVAVMLSQPIKGATIPVEIPPDVTVLNLSFQGLITQSWDYKITEINPDNGYAFVALANSKGLTIPVGTTTIFNMTFNTGTAECQVGSCMRWDTTLMDDPARALLFADINNYDLPPGFDYLRDSTLVPGYLPGDIDGNQSCDVADVTALVTYLFLYGPPPCVFNAADINGSCTGPNICDLTYIVDYLFMSGTAPVCGCLGIGQGSPLAKINPGISVAAKVENNTTTVLLSSPIELHGVQLELKGAGEATVANLLGEEFNLVYGQRDGVLRVGLLDLDGAEIVRAGEHQMISIPGEYELVSAVVSDMNHNDIIASIEKLSELPNRYALHQNYPNPFNPVTTISFSLKERTDYILTIYNLSGQMVTSFKGTADRGVKEIEWDASHHASGVYLYKLDAGNYTETRKMMLLK